MHVLHACFIGIFHSELCWIYDEYLSEILESDMNQNVMNPWDCLIARPTVNMNGCLFKKESVQREINKTHIKYSGEEGLSLVDPVSW